MVIKDNAVEATDAINKMNEIKQNIIDLHYEEVIFTQGFNPGASNNINLTDGKVGFSLLKDTDEYFSYSKQHKWLFVRRNRC